MSKQVKLSPSMKFVIEHMRMGYALGVFKGVGSIGEHAKIETYISITPMTTVRALQARGLLQETSRIKGDKFYHLTELGKTIQL